MEWMVHIWGGAFNADANPSIEKDYGITEGYHYFETKDAKDSFCAICNLPEYKKQGLMMHIEEGELTHKRTVFVGTFAYKDNTFVIHYDFGYEYPEESAEYMFTQGNYSCDCNRSIFIRNQHGPESVPDLGCGYEIELVDFTFVYLD